MQVDDDALEGIVNLIQRSNRIVALTGAGISTGIQKNALEKGLVALIVTNLC